VSCPPAFSRDLIEEVIGAAGKYIARHNNYRVKKPGETASTRHDGPATIQIRHANPRAA